MEWGFRGDLEILFFLLGAKGEMESLQLFDNLCGVAGQKSDDLVLQPGKVQRIWGKLLRVPHTIHLLCSNSDDVVVLQSRALQSKN